MDKDKLIEAINSKTKRRRTARYALYFLAFVGLATLLAGIASSCS